MMNNVDDENICMRMERFIQEFEQTKDQESTEIGRQFAQLQRTMMENREIYPSFEGAKGINRKKNRYKDVLPYDKHRVILHTSDESDYINASFVEDLKNYRRYIAAQGPIDESVADFIRMIWEYQITTVICTANEIEAGRFKFRRYWPTDEKFLQFGSYQITRDETSDKAYCCEYYEIRPLIITQGENRREILLYHFLHWFDHDIPDDEASILELLLRVYEDRSLSPETPILVHCSAGCGRTGSLIAIDLCRLLIQDERLLLSKEYESSPVYTIAIHIRQYRIALIQTLNQYLFVYKMFVYMSKTCGNLSFSKTTSVAENLTRKSSPPSSTRRLSVGHLNKSKNPLTNQPNLDDQSDQPPPIPPRQSLLNTTNKNQEGRFVPQGQIPIKAPRTKLTRSRNFRRRDPPMDQTMKNHRSDSADALAVSSNESRPRYTSRRMPKPIQQETNSD